MNIVEEQRMKYPNHKPWMIAHGPASTGATAQTLVEIISYPFKAAYDLIDGHDLDEREWRILVRQTPGDPTSSVERQADHVTPLMSDGKPVWAEEYCVRMELPYIA